MPLTNRMAVDLAAGSLAFLLLASLAGARPIAPVGPPPSPTGSTGEGGEEPPPASSEPFEKLDVSVPPSPSRRFGSVSGSFRALGAGPLLPALVTLRALDPLIPYPGRQPKRRIFQCPLSAHGAWTCRLPAATYDLAVGAEGFVPQRRQGVVVRPERNLPLGPFALERSNVIAGQVVAEDAPFDRLDPRLALVRVTPQAEHGDGGGPVYQGDPLLIERSVWRDGSFRIANVAPGWHTVEVRYPGYLPALREWVHVEPGEPVVLSEPLLLQHAVDLQLVIVPPVPPAGGTWSVRVYRNRLGGEGTDSRNEDTLGHQDDPERGIFTVLAIRPGRFAVKIEEAGYARDDLVVHDASDARVEIRLDILEVEGTVTLGGEPRADVGLLFEPVDGYSTTFHPSDDEGHFHGLLPAGPGRWSIQATLEENRLPVTLWRDLVEDRPGHATLDLQLPRTRLFGRVLDERGVPAEGGEVRVDALGLRTDRVTMEGQTDRFRRGAMQMVPLDHEGEFDLEGVPLGPLRLVAWAGGSDEEEPSLRSEEQEVEMEEGGEVGPVVLRLERQGALRIETFQAGKPVAGIEVDAYTASGFVDGAMSDEEGKLDLDVPPDAERLVLVAGPDEGSLLVRDVRTDRGAVRLEIEPGDGVLDLTLPAPIGRLNLGGQALEVEMDGAWIDNDELAAWREKTGGDSESTPENPVLYAMPPGHYRACLGPLGLDLRIDRRKEAAGKIRCVEGDLAPDERLELNLAE